jgi:hypothetical protein
MTPRLARLSAWLVEPAAAGAVAAPARTRPVAAAPPPEVAVLAPAEDAHALAAALALRLTRGPAVIGLWTGDVAAGAVVLALPAIPAARRLAAALAARDLPVARVGGRLVTVALPAGEPAAASAALRLTGAVTAAPVVLAAAGPRGDAWDQVLVDCDLVAVHAADDVLADLAVSRLTEQGADAVRIQSPGRLTRVLARAGVLVPGGLDVLAPAVRAVRR